MCVVCEKYREWLRQEDPRLVFEPGVSAQPSEIVLTAWEEEGCEPCLSDEGWQTACEWLSTVGDEESQDDFLAQLRYELFEGGTEDDPPEEEENAAAHREVEMWAKDRGNRRRDAVLATRRKHSEDGD